jgi:hypothetical protein
LRYAVAGTAVGTIRWVTNWSRSYASRSASALLLAACALVWALSMTAISASSTVETSWSNLALAFARASVRLRAGRPGGGRR